MSDILCKWLNEEIKFEPRLAAKDPAFGEKFSNGYLFGQLLYKHNLQPDFCLFSKGTSSDARLSNFIRLEPTFKLLSIPFSVNFARDVMTEKPGAAVQLLYQLFMALSRKVERRQTTQSLECMKSPGRVNLQRIETEIFQGRLRNQTPRQVDINFDELIEKFKEQRRLLSKKLADQEKDEEQQMYLRKIESCKQAREHSRAVRERRSLLYTKLKPLQHSKRVQSTPVSSSSLKQPTKDRDKAVAAETEEEIRAFELSLKDRPSIPLVAVHSSSTTEDKPTNTLMEKRAEPGGTVDYLTSLHQRVADINKARSERDKRRRRVLVEQMKALFEQEELKREKLLVERLSRRCQQERRIATQLMHIRKEKDTIRNNRILRQQQYAEQRINEFQQALDREAALALLEEKEKRERLRHHKEIYQRNMAEKAERSYQKNFIMCHMVVLQILDLATKIAHYRELTNKLVPAKLVRDWKTLFMAGRPLYEENLEASRRSAELDIMSSSLTRSTQLDTTTDDQLLNDIDFQEYKDGVGEWSPVESLQGSLPDPPNPILTHVVFRLLDQVDPPQPPPTPPHMPRFRLQACILGKPFSGKSSVLSHLKEKYDLIILNIEAITSKAVESYLAEKKVLDKEAAEKEEGGKESSTPTQTPTHPEDSTTVPTVPSSTSLAPHIALNPSSSMELTGSLAEHPESGTGTAVGAESGAGTSGVESGQGESSEPGEVKVMEENKENGFDSTRATVTVEIFQDQHSQLSSLAQLGQKAYSAMANGEALEDGLLVDVLVEEVRSLPEGCAWVLDNFPTTLAQAKLLSEALSTPAPPKPKFSRDYVLLGERKTIAEKQHACGLDVVFHLTASTDIILARASNQNKLNPGPHDNNKLEQIQHRVLSYTENWPSMRRWFSKFKVVRNIDADMELAVVCRGASAAVQEVINSNKQADAMKKLGYEDVLSCGSVTSFTSIISPASSKTGLIKPVRSTHSPLSLHRPSSAELASPSRGVRRIKKKVTKPQESPLRQAMHSSSGKEGGAKNKWVPVNLDVSVGGPEWVFFHLAIPQNLAQGMARKWSAIERTFIGTLKQVFQQLREERELICQYFFLRRKEFSAYLCRPDHKQEFITQWQLNYNQIEPHLRCEDLMKAELHHRIDDLGDKLWDICEHRKESSKDEEKRIAEEQWLEDHIGLLSNHYISVMQVELDRYQDTILLLKDYYNSTEDKVPEKLPEMCRVGLIDLQPTHPQDPPPSMAGSTQSMDPPAAELTENSKEEAGSTPTKEIKRRVTLVPRQAPPDPMVEEKTAAHRKKSYPVPAVTIAGMVDQSEGSLDHQLINFAYNTALIAVVSMAEAEVKVLDTIIAEAKKPPKPKTPPPEVKEEKPAKGKKGKASPSAKKRGKTPTGKKTPPAKKGAAAPEPPPESPKPPTLTHDEIISKHRKLHMCKEFKEAILMEENRIKNRLELIRVKSIAHVNMLNSTGTVMQEEMDKWVQTCYDQEMTSVSHLLDVLRQAVENEEKLLNEITLPGVKFEIRESIITFVQTPPPSPPPPMEQPDHTYFTVEQLQHLHRQLSSVCPSGYMLVRVLVDTLQTMTSRSSSADILPQLWSTASKQQMEMLVEHLYGPDTDFVDWHRLLLCAALPWPLPSVQDLLEAWSVLVKDKNSVGKKVVNRAEFMAAEIWLDRHSDTMENSFVRNHAFKAALFDMFCEGELLDVKRTLLYLCADPYPKAGIFKALSLVTGSPVVPHQDIDEQVTILLEDFHQILTLGSQSHAGISMEDLLEVFLQVDSRNPNEVALASLLVNKTVINLMHSTTGYFLPDLSVLLKPTHTPSVEGTN